MEYRYRDKAYLSNYMLDTKLFDSFGFLVEDAAPIRSVYIITTDEGPKILKKVDYPIRELMFIYDSLNEIRRNYPYVVNFRESKSKTPYVEYCGGTYVVLDLIEGRECVFENPIDLSLASGALAKFHKAGENIRLSYYKRCCTGDMLQRLQSRICDMEKYREIALMHINKSDFDKLYLEYVDYYIKCIYSSREHLKKSAYIDLSEKLHTLCHHDLAHHNILLGEDGNVYFIDFDYAVIDLPCHDVSNIITKAVKHNGWDPDISDTIMEAYLGERDASEEELSILYGYLMFPQDFYNISTSYYMRTRDWDEDEFVDKLKRKAEYKDEREKFLKEFKNRWVH